MARDPDHGGAFVFDLVDDDAVDPGAPPAGPGSDDGPDPGADPDGPDPDAPPPDGHRPSLRVLAPVAAVLAVLLGTGFAVDGLREGLRAERMRDVHGGVVDVSSPLEEAWAWEGHVGPPAARSEGRWNEVAVLGGLLAFQSGRDLVALDPESGDEAWRVGLGVDPDCGPLGMAAWSDVVARRLVCLAGPAAERVVRVIGADGAVLAERTVDPADTERYGEPRPGPDGMLLRAQRVGPAGDPDLSGVRCDSESGCTGTVEEGQDLELRAEDAGTGEERWSLTVPFRPTPADQCTTWYEGAWSTATNLSNQRAAVDTAGFGANVTDRLVQLYGCGVQVAVSPAGSALGTEIDPWVGGVEALRGGGYAGYTYDEHPRTVLYGADGEVVGEIDGYALEPTATDGSGLETMMSAGSPDSGQSYEADGTPRWDQLSRRGVQQFLAQVGGTAVVLAGAGAVHGLDLATGEEQWSWDEPGTSGAYLSRAFTDGRSVLVVVENGAGGAGLTALDAASGAVMWERPADVPDASTWASPFSGFVAVDGHLLEVTADGVRGWR